MTSQTAGLGAANAKLRIYIANRPAIAPYDQLDVVRPMVPGEIAALVAQTSNHWRKLFNVLAKLQFALGQRQTGWSEQSHASWQSLRDHELLQRPGQLQLLFSSPESDARGLQVVCGKHYAGTLGLALDWLDAHFARALHAPLIVSPYPDYRQLTNERIERLADLLVAR